MIFMFFTCMYLVSIYLASYLTNRFHVTVHLFSNRSEMMSKCGKNKKGAHEAIAEFILIKADGDVNLRLSSNRSYARTNQNVRITWVIITIKQSVHLATVSRSILRLLMYSLLDFMFITRWVWEGGGSHNRTNFNIGVTTNIARPNQDSGNFERFLAFEVTICNFKCYLTL